MCIYLIQNDINHFNINFDLYYKYWNHRHRIDIESDIEFVLSIRYKY